MLKLQKACRNYNAWKAEHSPELKPWLFPEQSSLPRLNPADIGRWEPTESPVADEGDVVAIQSDGGEEDDSFGVHPGSAAAAASFGNSNTVEEMTASIPMAAAEPAVADIAAVPAGAN